MKLLKITIYMLCTISFASCATRPFDKPPTFQVTQKSYQESNLAKIKLAPRWFSSIFESTTGIYAYDLEVENTSQTPLRVSWRDSGVFAEGFPGVIFQSGQAYSNSDTPFFPAIIPPGQKLRTQIFSNNQVYQVLLSDPRIGLRVISGIIPEKAEDIFVYLQLNTFDQEELIEVHVSMVPDQWTRKKKEL